MRQAAERHSAPDSPTSSARAGLRLDLLRRIWHVRPETARRVRQRISAVMQWSQAMEYRADNPCDRLGPVLGPQQTGVEHMRALPHRDVAGAIRNMWRSGATPPATTAVVRDVPLGDRSDANARALRRKPAIGR